MLNNLLYKNHANLDEPNILVKLLHGIPHINITLHLVNDTFDPQSGVYVESLGILATIPAACLILFLIGLLLYFLTRCCDRKPRKARTQTCSKSILIVTTILCCLSVGIGLYGNDDLHNGLLQTFESGRHIQQLISSFKNKTELLKHGIQNKVLSSEIEEILDPATHNQTALGLIMDGVRLVRENTTRAVSSLETILYLIRPPDQEHTMENVLGPATLFETIRWPATLGFLAAILILCLILVIGLIRSSRCSLIFFSVMGLFCVIVCWLLSGIYLATTVAAGDFCMRPREYICRQVGDPRRPDNVNYLNCGRLRDRFVLRLNESRESIDRAQEALFMVSKMSKDIYPPTDTSTHLNRIDSQFRYSHDQLIELVAMLDQRNVDKFYNGAIRGVCNYGILGMTLLMLGGLLTSFFLTILVCVDSHTWVYLTKKKPYVDKSETAPLFSTSSTMSPTAPITSGTLSTNRTLLHHQQSANTPLMHTMSHTGMRNGNTATIKGLAYSGDSPPPDYNVVVHGNRSSGHHTLGRLPSHSGMTAYGANGKYATLSRQCKTLEANDFY